MGACMGVLKFQVVWPHWLLFEKTIMPPDAVKLRTRHIRYSHLQSQDIWGLLQLKLHLSEQIIVEKVAPMPMPLSPRIDPTNIKTYPHY
jgi:hypothetical protein